MDKRQQYSSTKALYEASKRDHDSTTSCYDSTAFTLSETAELVVGEYGRGAALNKGTWRVVRALFADRDVVRERLDAV